MQEPAPHPLSDAGLGLLVSAVRRRVKQVIWARLVPLDLTPQQFWVLLVLQQKGPQSLHPLAQAVWMDDPTASRVVKALGERGLVTSTADPAHGRRILISPTTEGTLLTRELQALADEVKARLLAGLDDAEQLALRQGLLRMLGNMDALAEQTPKIQRPGDRRPKQEAV
jgi:DNA-binding MarR family transcriptional regulator